MKMSKKNHAEAVTREPLFHVTKRDTASLKRSIGVRAVAILAALVLAGIATMLLTGNNPLKVYASFFEGAFGSSTQIWSTLKNLALLLGISLAVTPAYKMRFWNTGAEGQVLIGCLATAFMMWKLGAVVKSGSMPEWLLIVFMLLAAVASGVIWGVIPAIFKAQWGTNETLFTLMMNYVAIQLIEFFLKIADKSGSNTVGPRILDTGWLPKIGGNQYLIGIIVVALMTVFMYVYLKYSKHGYEISVVGESENTARYIGINVKKVVIRTMALSGGLCGLIGFLIVAGNTHSIDPNLAAGRGFTAIVVSWLAKFNPLFMVLASFLLVFLSQGAVEVSTSFGLNDDYAEIITGIILFFIIGCEFFLNYEVHINHSRLPVFLCRKGKSAPEKEGK